MAENWSAVANSVNERVKELGWRQRELAQRAQVSQAIVRELQQNRIQRRRSARTLEALSLALGWHPQHLLAVCHGRKPPAVNEPRENMDDPVSARLSLIEDRLTTITEQLAGLREELAAVLAANNRRNKQ
ncbi:MAG: helix-turn-helix domain-containing protein [Sciscionella sp.]